MISFSVLLGVLGVLLVAASAAGMAYVSWTRRPEHWQLLIFLSVVFLVQFLIAPPDVYTAYTTNGFYTVKAGLLSLSSGLFTATLTRMFVKGIC